MEAPWRSPGVQASALVLALLLVTSAIPFTPTPGASAVSTSNSDTCALDRSGQLVVGDLERVGADGVSGANESIPQACQGHTYALTGSNAGDDLDLCWKNGTDATVRCDRTPGGERGAIPAGAVEADITYFAGAGGTYHLKAGPAAGTVNESIDLFLHGGPSHVGPVDLIFNESQMDPTPPTKQQPSVWWSNPLVPGGHPNTVWDANWRWIPQGGYDLDNARFDVTFWTVSPGSSVDVNGWQVELFSDGGQVAHASTVDREPAGSALGGTALRWNVSMGPVSVDGEQLTLQINPFFFDADYAHAILYDSVDFPSALSIDADPLPVPIPDLNASFIHSTFVDLDWSKPDVSGIDAYQVLRNGSEIATTTDTAYRDATVNASTNYSYQVEARNATGALLAVSDKLNVTTPPPDVTAPSIENVTVQTGGTVATVSWTTNESTTGTLTVGPNTSRHPNRTSPLGTEHRVHVTGLDPNEAYVLNVTAEDLSGNENSTGNISTTTGHRETYWLHNQGDQRREFADLFDDPTDNNLDGWNALGGISSTIEQQTDGAFVSTVQNVYPVREPASPTIELEPGEDVEATIYISHSAGGGQFQGSNHGHVALNLTVFANDDVLASQVVETRDLFSVGWIPLFFDMQPRFQTIEADTLRFELRAEEAPNGYVIGFEGNHASHVELPLAEDLPLDPEIVVHDDRVMEGASTTLSVEATGGTPPFNATWSFPNGSNVTGTTVEHVFAEEGNQAVTVSLTDAEGITVNETTTVPVRQRDFVDDGRTVVAVVDSGTNPYHPVFQRPGAELPLSDLVDARTGDQPRVIDLADQGDFDTRVNDLDRDDWASIEDEELVYFNGTNLLGVGLGDASPPILDPQTHGTATTSTVAQIYPDALVVAVQAPLVLSPFNTSDQLSQITEGVQWATDQPWIDVISVSAGAPGNAPTVTDLADVTKDAVAKGKVVVFSSGNDPSPNPTDPGDSPPWVVAVAGSQHDGQGREPFSTYTYPDFISDFTVRAAQAGTTEDRYSSVSGTSFSGPRVAGAIAGTIREVRDSLNHTAGITGGELAPGVTNHDVRDALNRSARYPGAGHFLAGFTPGLTHGHPGPQPSTSAGWGYVDEETVEPAVQAILDGDLGVPADKQEDALYMQATHAARKAIWNPATASQELPANPVLNPAFEIYADAVPAGFPQDAGGADEALLWSHWVSDGQTKTTDFQLLADDDASDREMVVAPCPPNAACSSHNAWQSFTQSHGQAISGDFDAYALTIEEGAEFVPEQRDARVHVLLSLSPGDTQHPLLGVFWDVGLQLHLPDDLSDGRLKLDPTDASLFCRGAILPDGEDPCESFRANWTTADEEERREMLSRGRIVQHGFWDLNRQHHEPTQGEIVIDDVAIEGASPFHHARANPCPTCT